jgi:hypothetical protein
MTRPRETIVVSIAFATLLAVAAFFGLAAILASQATLTGNAPPGSIYLLLMNSADEIRSIFAVALIVVTVGINILGRDSTPAWMLYSSSALCTLALVACFALLVGLKDADVARPLWSNADQIMTFEQLQTGNRHLLELVAAWLGTFLATSLGVALTRSSAPVAGSAAPPRAAGDGAAPPAAPNASRSEAEARRREDSENEGTGG